MRHVSLIILTLLADPTLGSLRVTRASAPTSEKVSEKCCCCERGKCQCGCDRPRESSQELPGSDAACPCGRETPLPTVPARSTADTAPAFVGHVDSAYGLAPVDVSFSLQFRAVHDPPDASSLSTIVLLI